MTRCRRDRVMRAGVRLALAVLLALPPAAGLAAGTGALRAAWGAAAPAMPSDKRTVAAVDVVQLDGIVGPATARYVLRGLRQASADGAEALVIEMDTPGGLMTSMDQIAKALLASPIPSIVYVWPSGARAASAGVFITYAANVAAMAPTTHLGAAHPVNVAPGGGTTTEDKTMIAKVTNDAVAEIRGFAARRGRNADWAERAVRESVSITDQDALRLHVIDLIAANPPAMLAAVDGRQVETGAGRRALHTRGARLVEIPMDVTERLLLLLGDPNIGFVLMTMAIYGIIFELSNPGSVFPGVIGGLALILALASFAVIEVNIAGLLLIGFALILFIADIKVPSHGILTAGGLAAFILGALMLTERQAPFLRISLTLILTMGALTAAFFAFAVGAGIRAQHRRVYTGREALLGAVGVARTDLAPSGTVFVEGELWSAESEDGAIPVGQRVRVVQIKGLHLVVRKEEVTR
ncbi:MAG TPA: nodulation protein NfeD [bacterium]|nr:nodulation protein NfeD [bacterium]